MTKSEREASLNARLKALKERLKGTPAAIILQVLITEECPCCTCCDGDGSYLEMIERMVSQVENALS